MRAQYVQLEPGRLYRNRGGGTYRCIAGDGAAAARMQNTASGWMLLAHGTQMYPDGTIEWDYSTQMGFAPLPAGRESGKGG